MNKLVLAGIFGAALLAKCCGDDFASLYPLYGDRDLVYEEGLVGTWYIDDDDWRVIFSRAGEGYQVTIEEKDGSEWKEASVVDCFLVRLDGSLFVDLSKSGEAIRGHAYFIITLDGGTDTLQATWFKNDWLEEKVVDEAALQHLDVPGTGTVITAPTRELQRFVRKYAHDPDAFEEWISFHRRAPDSGDGAR